jgi:hypothetical protein
MTKIVIGKRLRVWRKERVGGPMDKIERDIYRMRSLGEQKYTIRMEKKWLINLQKGSI